LARIARNKRRGEALIPLPPGRLAVPQHGGNEAAFATEHDDRLKTIFVVVRIALNQRSLGWKTCLS